MNKISKKIVSLVTMAAFATTLVPTAAFAGVSGDADLSKSAIKIEQVASNTLEVTYDVNKADDGISTGMLTNVDLDVTGVGGTPVTGVEYYGNNSGKWVKDYEIPDGTKSVRDNYTYRIVLPEAGSYEVTSTSDADQLTGSGTYAVTTTNIRGSQLLAIDDNGNAVTSVAVDQNEKATIEFKVIDTANATTKLPVNDNGRVVVWATQGSNIVTNAVFGGTATVSGNNPYVYVINNGNAVNDENSFTVAFPAEGDYVIHAAVVTGTLSSGTTESAVFEKATILGTLQTVAVKVEAPAVVTNSVTFDQGTNGVWYINDNVTPSDTKEYTVTGTAYEAVNNPAENTTLTLSCDDNGDGITLQSTEVKTDEKGNFSFKFTLSETARYDINVINEEGKVIGTLTIDQDDVNAATIDIAKDGGTMLAGNDATYSAGVYGNGDVTFGDAVQFEITDVYGQVSEGGLVLKDEYAASEDPADADKHAANLRIVDKPKATETTAASTLEASDLVLAWDGSAYTLKYVGDNYAKDLVPGEYKVRVALNNGGDNAVTVSFTLAKFGEIESIDFNLTAAPRTADSYDDNAIQAIDDQVALGQYVSVEPEYVDVNGIHVTIPAKNYDAAVTGKAVDTSNTTFGNFNFTTRYNTVANESLIGSEVTVQVFDKNLGYQTKTLTIVSAYLNETLAFDSEQGPVGESNLVNVTVVDENGNLSKVNGTLSARVESQSNEEATIDVDVNKAVKNGAGKIYVESDAEGTADIVVAVKADNGEMYAKTLTYTFGDEDPYAGTSVVMTIGSDQYLINNELFDGSVDNLGAPYVDSAWRTMVPARILAETFGGTVEFDEVDGVQTVSIVNGDTTIEMTVGSADYTINGEAAKAMDTEPVIVDGRTYVPVRFVAEGLGLDVTPLYDAETGTTASVVFQK